MGLTTKREFTSTSDWMPLTQLTKVYSGNLSIDEKTQTHNGMESYWIRHLYMIPAKAI